MTRLSPHFTLNEFTRSQTATRYEIDNTPDNQSLIYLVRTAHALERLRRLVERPIHVSSGYRSPALNKRIGGAFGSAHTRGLAADISVDGMSVERLVEIIRASDIQYDTVINEFNRWTHISISEYGIRPRKRNLLAFKQGGQTVYRGLA